MYLYVFCIIVCRLTLTWSLRLFGSLLTISTSSAADCSIAINYVSVFFPKKKMPSNVCSSQAFFFIYHKTLCIHSYLYSMVSKEVQQGITKSYRSVKFRVAWKYLVLHFCWWIASKKWRICLRMVYYKRIVFFIS